MSLVFQEMVKLSGNIAKLETGNDTTTGTNNRMETVEREIKKVTKKAKTIFVLPVKATDSRPNTVIEKSVREQIGIPVSKDLAHYRRLPYQTEWVLEAQSHLTNIRTKINKKKGKQEMDTGLLWEVQQTTEHTENEGNLPRNLKLQDGEVHRARKYMVHNTILLIFTYHYETFENFIVLQYIR